MLIIWSLVVGVLIFLGIVVVTLAFGAAANKAGKEALVRTEAERRAGVTEDVTSDTPHPSHERPVEA